MAALLTSVRDDKDKSALYLAECRHMGITVLPPDVNSSVGNFAAVGADIRFGLGAIRNVGANVVAEIVKTRETKGEFSDFTDFLAKVPAVVCNKRTIESLVKAGAFDSLGHTRRALMLVHEQAVDSVVGVKRKEAEGQFDLFADLGGTGDDGLAGGVSVEVPDVPDWDKKQLLAFEREMLGLYVSDHPLSGLEHVLAQAADVSVANLLADEPPRPEGSQVTVAGLVSTVERRFSKAGNPWAKITLEDMSGSIEVLFFGEVYQTFSTMLVEDQVAVVRGRIRKRDDSVELQAVEVSIPDTSLTPDAPVQLHVPEARCTPSVLEQLREVLSTHPGGTEVQVRVTAPGRATVLRLEDSLRVQRSSALFGDLKALLGPGCLV